MTSLAWRQTIYDVYAIDLTFFLIESETRFPYATYLTFILALVHTNVLSLTGLTSRGLKYYIAQNVAE